MGMSFSLLLFLGRACTTKAFVNRGRPLFGMSSPVAGPLLSQRFTHSDVQQGDTPRVHRLLRPPTFCNELEVVFNHPLGHALSKLPKVSFANTQMFWCKFPLKRADGGEGDFGTSFKPNVTALLAAAAPLPIGKELTTETISIPEADMKESCQKWVAEKLFPDKEVTLRFHKMSIFETGEHYDFHRDTTHADNHHATLLAEVKSAHNGGQLTMEVDGAEVKGVDFSESDPYKLAVVAFRTNVRHKLEPVTEGTRIVLQFDVLVEKDKVCEKEEDDLRDPYLEHTNTIDHDFPADPSKLDDVLSTLKNAFEDIETAASQEENAIKRPKFIALPLFHLYRKASILPDHLKGVDRDLFHALLKTGLYNAALSPIVIKAETDRDGSFGEKGYSACLSDPVEKIYTEGCTEGQVQEVAVGGDHIFNTQKAPYIVSKRESSHELESIEHIESEETGEVLRQGMAKYFLCAMLISEKT